MNLVGFVNKREVVRFVVEKIDEGVGMLMVGGFRLW